VFKGISPLSIANGWKKKLSTGQQCSGNPLIILESVMKNTYKYLSLQSNSFRPTASRNCSVKKTVTHFSEHSREVKLCIKKSLK